MEVKDLFSYYAKIAEDYFSSLSFEIENEDSLKDAVIYSFFSGGKRFRPVLMLATADYLKLDFKQVLPYAFSMECVHTHSLIHDDLPALDNSDFRRGSLSCHKKFNESTAVLAGDWLLNFAYLSLLNSSEEKFSAKAFKEFAKSVDKMLVGQVKDTQSDFDKTLEGVLEVYKLKTSALISSCFTIPVVLAGLDDLEEDFCDFGENLGLLFQITDDLIDYNQNRNEVVELNLIEIIGLNKTLALKGDLINKCYKFSDKYKDFTFAKFITDYVAERNF